MSLLWAAVGGYVVASVLLLKFPTILHRKKNVKFFAKHISHRGGAAENLENTMVAFQHAVSLGTHMLELDVQLTSDGQVVVCHDDHLLRLTGEDICISETNYQDLPRLKSAVSIDFLPGVKFTSSCSEEDRNIALLKDVFEKFPNMPINIDIKADNDSLIQTVNTLVKEYDREEISVWGNRSSTVCDKLYSINPRVPLLTSVRKTLVLNLLFYLGLLPFVPIRESYYEIVMPSIALRRLPKERLTTKWRMILKTADFLLMNRVCFKHLQDRGIQVFLWVLNDEDEFARAFDYSVDGVMTDCPTKLKRFLETPEVDELDYLETKTT